MQGSKQNHRGQIIRLISIFMLIINPLLNALFHCTANIYFMFGSTKPLKMHHAFSVMVICCERGFKTSQIVGK